MHEISHLIIGQNPSYLLHIGDEILPNYIILKKNTLRISEPETIKDFVVHDSCQASNGCPLETPFHWKGHHPSRIDRTGHGLPLWHNSVSTRTRPGDFLGAEVVRFMKVAKDGKRRDI